MYTPSGSSPSRTITAPNGNETGSKLSLTRSRASPESGPSRRSAARAAGPVSSDAFTPLDPGGDLSLNRARHDRRLGPLAITRILQARLSLRLDDDDHELGVVSYGADHRTLIDADDVRREPLGSIGKHRREPSQPGPSPPGDGGRVEPVQTHAEQRLACSVQVVEGEHAELEPEPLLTVLRELVRDRASTDERRAGEPRRDLEPLDANQTLRALLRRDPEQLRGRDDVHLAATRRRPRFRRRQHRLCGEPPRSGLEHPRADRLHTDRGGEIGRAHV